MKKFISLILMILLCFALASPVMAAEFENPPLVDEAGYLTEEEFEDITQRLEVLRQKYNFEVAIYTEVYLSAETAQDAADDIYDYKGYGGGEGDDGIMLYICSDTRQYHFTTYNYGRTAFTDNGLIYLEGKVVPELAEDDYYEAMKLYAVHAGELLEMAANGEPYDKNPIEYVIMVIAVAAILPLIVAFLMMIIKLAKMRTAVKQDYAANYMKKNSMNLEVSRDMYLYSTVTKTEKPKSDSNGSSHKSSSGRVHGGRGGSF